MNKKILQILTIFYFFNFGLNIQSSFTTPSKEKIRLKDPMGNNDISKIDFDDMDLKSIKDLNETEKLSPSLKEKLSMLAEILKDMTLKEKLYFISALIQEQLKKHKKISIISAASLTTALTTYIILTRYKKGK